MKSVPDISDPNLPSMLAQQLNTDALSWLLEPDQDNPGVRYFALKELCELPDDHEAVIQAQIDVMRCGPVPVILSHQRPDGTWERDKDPYNPKYFSTIWQVIMLAQLGASGNDPRIRLSCEFMLDKNRSSYGGFTFTPPSNAGLIHCMQGNIAAALIDLGWLGDERLAQALDWMARSVTGEGIAPAEQRQAHIRYYRSGNSGPGFLCSANNHKACTWGAVKVMLALSKIPSSVRTPAMQNAIDTGLNFLLGVDPATAAYPTFDDRKPSSSWFRFGYPIFYVTDLLQNLEVVTALGMSKDPRLHTAVDLLLKKQDANGRWLMNYSYNGKTWVNIEIKKQPSKWVTLRALRVLKRIYA